MNNVKMHFLTKLMAVFTVALALSPACLYPSDNSPENENLMELSTPEQEQENKSWLRRALSVFVPSKPDKLEPSDENETPADDEGKNEALSLKGLRKRRNNGWLRKPWKHPRKTIAASLAIAISLKTYLTMRILLNDARHLVLHSVVERDLPGAYANLENQFAENLIKGRFDPIQVIFALPRCNDPYRWQQSHHMWNFNVQAGDLYQPLRHAATRGRSEIIGRLLEAGANPKKHTDDDMAPILVAAEAGHVNSVRMFFEHITDPEFYTSAEEGPSGASILNHAKEQFLEINPNYDDLGNATERTKLSKKIAYFQLLSCAYSKLNKKEYVDENTLEEMDAFAMELFTNRDMRETLAHPTTDLSMEDIDLNLTFPIIRQQMLSNNTEINSSALQDDDYFRLLALTSKTDDKEFFPKILEILNVPGKGSPWASDGTWKLHKQHLCPTDFVPFGRVDNAVAYLTKDDNQNAIPLSQDFAHFLKNGTWPDTETATVDS